METSNVIISLSTRPMRTQISSASSRVTPRPSSTMRDCPVIWYQSESIFAKQNQDNYSVDILGKSKEKNISRPSSSQRSTQIKKKLQQHEDIKAKLQKRKKAELEKRNRLKQMIKSHRQLLSQMQQAAVMIQKHIRGFLVRKVHRDFIIQISKAKLETYLNILNQEVEAKWKKFVLSNQSSAVLIQKTWRGHTQRKKYKVFKAIQDAKILQKKKQYEATLVIQRCFRASKGRSFVSKILVIVRQAQALNQIKKRLNWIKFKQFWDVYKFKWKVIREHYGIAPEISCQNTLQDSIEIVQSIEIPQPPFIQKTQTSLQQQQRPPSIPSYTMKRPYTSNNFQKPTKAFIRKTRIQKEKKVKKINSYRYFNNMNYQKPTASRRFKAVNVGRNCSGEQLKPVSRQEFRADSRKSSVETAKPVSKPPRTRYYTPKAVVRHSQELEDQSTIRIPPPDPEIVNLLNSKGILDEASNRDLTQRTYNYKPPVNRTYQFKQALPELYEFIQMYPRK